MIDPDLMYCPTCNDEYRADIKRCAACDVDLISGSMKIEEDRVREEKLAGRKGDITPDDDIVTIHRAPLAEIKRLEELLDKERIGYLVTGDDSSCGKGCCPSAFDLKVRREEAEEVLAIIDEENRSSTFMGRKDEGGNNDSVFNPHAREAVCPACGCSFSTSTTTCPDCGLSFG
ncbi:MAG: hypothetical protein KAI75_09675 [Desulfobulbaceae bacterium]|nr:hypothetical protein [Desulfobulbaceae bacterium]